MRALGVGLAFLVLVAAAGGATVPADLVPARLTLQPTDLPAARVVSQGPVHERGYDAGYQRTFTFATPSAASGFRFVQSEALLASTAAKAAAAVDRLRASFASKTGRTAYAVAIAKALRVKTSAVRVSTPRTPRVGDRAVELPLSVVVGRGRVFESVLYMQLDRMVNVVVSSGVRPIVPAETRAFAATMAAHIDTALKPRILAAPTVFGDAVVGSVLTGTTGDWSGDATFTVQWQRCDPSSMECSEIAGATTQTYTVSDGDVGFSLREAVTATNRFGSSIVQSGQTAVVEAPPPPPPPPELP